MEKSDKKVMLRAYIIPDLLEELQCLHEKEGPVNIKTQKRRPFSAYISKILWAHVIDRHKVIDGLASIKEWDDSQFE